LFSITLRPLRFFAKIDLGEDREHRNDERKILLHPEKLTLNRVTPLHSPNSAAPPLVGDSPLKHSGRRYARSKKLPRGAQCDLMNAAAFSEHLSTPLNSFVTINAEHLQRIGSDSVFNGVHLWDGFRNLTELMRKWFTQRGSDFLAIWSREGRSAQARQPGEHWHIGLHLPHEHRDDFASQMVPWTGVEIAVGRTTKQGMLAVATDDSWFISKKDGWGRPEHIARYLGKAEPSQVRLHGQMKPNLKKPFRGKVGGEGLIEGKRYGVSRALNRAAQASAGFSPPRVAPFVPD